jgi:hypothetical protein
MSSPEELKSTPRYDRIVAASRQIAWNLGHSYVGVEHLFLAIVRTQTLCPPKSSAGSSRRPRLVLPSVTSSPRKGGVAAETTRRRPAQLWSLTTSRCPPRTRLIHHPTCRRSPAGRLGPRWVRTAAGICGCGRSRAVTTGAKEPQVTRRSPPRPRTAKQHGGGFESHLTASQARCVDGA